MAGMRDIREEELVIGQMSFREEQALAAKNMLLWEAYSRFWRPALDLGKECFRGLVGDIFTDPEKEEFDRQDKILVSVPEIIPRLSALEGMQIAGRREGVIVAEGAEDAPDTEAATRILSSIQSENQLGHEYTRAFGDAMISSYPSFIFFDAPTDWRAGRTLDVYHEAWDACLPDPNFRRVDMLDSVIRIKAVSKDKLKEMYPRREQVIEDKVYQGRFEESEFQAGNIFTSEERNTLFFQLNEAAGTFERTGLVYIIERIHFVYRMGTVWISPNSELAEMLPATWTPEEVQKWQQENPDYQPVQRKVRTCWVTTSTSTNVLLENAPHWFQENELPCEMYIPKLWDNKPYGVVQFLLGSNKLKNYARIEHLHSLRLANDNLMKVKEGSVKNPEDLESESGRVGGKIIIDKDAEMTDVEVVANRREQLGWLELAAHAEDDMSRISVERNFYGSAQSSQESGKLFEKRVEQTQVKHAPDIDTYNYFFLRCNRKILKMLPYRMTEYQMIRYIKEDNKPATLEVNKPVAFDWTTGAATRLHNNMAGAKYDYREAHGDNSVTGKEHELQVFQEVLKNVLPGVEPSMWPFLLSTIPNRLANEFGRKIQEKIDNTPPPTDPMKKSLAIKGEDLLHNPMVLEVLRQEGVLQPPQPGGNGAPMAAAPQPKPQAQGVAA